MHDDGVFYAIFSCKTPQKSCAQRHRAVNFALTTIFNTFSGVRVLLSRVLKTAAAMALSTTLIAPAAAQSDQFALPAPAADSFSKAQNLRDRNAEAVLPNEKTVTSLSKPTELHADTQVASFQQGSASWYGDKFHNRLTANGERYNMNAMTAAHKTLPFGTLVRVESPSTGKSVVVRINDRGPYAKGRIIDLSRAAATQLGVKDMGVYRVKLYRADKSGKKGSRITS